MILKIQTKIKDLLPLRVEEASWNDPTLHFYGTDWSFWSLAAWRITLNNKLIFGSDDGENPEIANLIKSSLIERVESQSPNFPVDPSFYFADGHVLETFSDASYDTWTFRLPNNVVYDFSSDDGATLRTDKIGSFVEITDFLPLMIDKIVDEGSVLKLQGKDWQFSVNSAWRVIHQNENSDFFGRGEPHGKKDLSVLKNSSIQSVQIQTERFPIDPVFFFSNNYRLEVFSASSHDSWKLQLPQGKVILSIP